MTDSAPATCSRRSTGRGSRCCPVSGTVGLKLDVVTLKALLTPSAFRRLDGREYWFCRHSECDVVYFDREGGSAFRKSDLRVRIGAKEKTDPIPVCYCFDVSEADLRREIEKSGKTSIPAMIAAEVRAGHCACEVRNPQGTCCLGSVSKAAERIRAEVATSAAALRSFAADVCGPGGKRILPVCALMTQRAPILEAAIPVLSVNDLSAATDYYHRVLGSQVGWTWGSPPEMASVCRDKVEVNLRQRGKGGREGPSRVYFQMSGVDEYYEQVKTAGAIVTVVLGDRPYGMRDFGLQDLSGNDLHFGSPAVE